MKERKPVAIMIIKAQQRERGIMFYQFCIQILGVCVSSKGIISCDDNDDYDELKENPKGSFSREAMFSYTPVVESRHGSIFNCVC